MNLETGTIGLALAPTLDAALRLRGDSRYEVQFKDIGNNYAIWANPTTPPTDNKLVRQAMNYAIDRLDIMELYARHASAMDGGDAEGFLDVFTPDAEAYFQKGHEALRAYHVGFLRDAAFPGSQHFALQWRILEGDDTRHEVRAYLMRLHRIPGAANCQVVWLGFYNDIVVKVGDRWMFQYKSAAPSENLRAAALEGELLGRQNSSAWELYDMGATDRRILAGRGGPRPDGPSGGAER